ncbi:MAG: penicillin-binding protein 2 [Candidatus Eisenbacteria bacterium]
MRQRSFLPNSKQSKVAVFKLIAVVVLVVIVARLFYLQIWHGRAFAEQAKNNRVRLEILPRIRGRLLDRHGRIVSENVLSYCLLFDAYEKEFVSDRAKVDAVLGSLDSLLGLDRLDDWRATVDKGKDVPFRPVTLLCNLDIRQISVIEERRTLLPGVRIVPRPRRFYPYGQLGCHLIGYVSEVTRDEIRTTGEDVYEPGDMAGRTGAEGEKESVLRGKNGKEYVEVDARGRRVNPTPDRPPLPPREPAVAGTDVVLTLDMELQRAAEATLDRFGSGAVVVLDPRDGAVLALASKPGFDPNVFSVGLSLEVWQELNRNPLHPLLNRVTQALYPPGSTMKVLTAAAALEEGIAHWDTQLEPCGGAYRFGRRVFHCWKEEGHGRLNLLEAVEASCDVYFYQLGIRLGIDRMYRAANRFGLNRRTAIELPDEKGGFYPSVDWYDRTFGKGMWGKGVVLNLAIGQGEILVTPIQLACLCAATANGGRLYAPYITAGEVPFGGKVPSVAAPVHRRPRALLGFSDVTLATLKEAMERAVSGPRATGRAASVPGVRVAGKTGTAQNPHGDDHALFIGFAPAEAPEVAFAMVVENAGHGGSVAAPAAGQILRQYFGLADTLAVTSHALEDSLAAE